MDVFFAETPSGVMLLNEGTTIAPHDLGLLGIIVKPEYRIRKL